MFRRVTYAVIMPERRIGNPTFLTHSSADVPKRRFNSDHQVEIAQQRYCVGDVADELREIADDASGADFHQSLQAVLHLQAIELDAGDAIQFQELYRVPGIELYGFQV